MSPDIPARQPPPVRGPEDADPPPAPPMGDAARATTGASVVAGGLWSGASGFVPQLYTLVVSIVAARYLGIDRLGQQSFIAFALLTTTALVTAGFPISIMRYTGELLGRGETGLVRALLMWAWGLEGFGAVVGGGALAIAALSGADPGAAWLLAALACSLGILQTAPSALLIGAQRWRTATIVGLVTGGLATLATVVVLVAGGGIVGMFAVEAVASVVSLARTGVLAQRALGEMGARSAPVDPAALRALKRDAVRYAAYASITVIVTVVVWTRSEFFFLKHYSDDAQIALYSIAFASVSAVLVMPRNAASALSPAFATLFGAGAMDRIASGYSRSLRLLMLLGLPLGAGMAALGPAAIRLAYGDAYRGTGSVLLVMVAIVPVIPLLTASNALLTGLGRVRLQVGSGLAAVAIDLAASFILIPRHGALGAAIASSLAQVSATLVLLTFGWRSVGRVDWQGKVLARGLVASVASGVVAAATLAAAGDTVGVPLGVVTGTLAFVALAATLRIVPAKDAAWLQETAGPRLGGRGAALVRRCAARD